MSELNEKFVEFMLMTERGIPFTKYWDDKTLLITQHALEEFIDERIEEMSTKAMQAIYQKNIDDALRSLHESLPEVIEKANKLRAAQRAKEQDDAEESG